MRRSSLSGKINETFRLGLKVLSGVNPKQA
jgi:hypothetical protein